MAKKNTKKTVEADVETPVVETATVVEEAVVKSENEETDKTPIATVIENVVSEVADNLESDIQKVKEQEATLMASIESNPEAAPELIENEINRVDGLISELNEKIETLEVKTKSTPTIFVTSTWNGWNYEE
jgi:hypothetical protein